MTAKEKAIVRQLGYMPFTLYQYLKAGTCSSKDLEYDLGLSRQSVYRALHMLKNINIIQSTGTTMSRRYFINDEKLWNIS